MTALGHLLRVLLGEVPVPPVPRIYPQREELDNSSTKPIHDACRAAAGGSRWLWQARLGPDGAAHAVSDEVAPHFARQAPIGPWEAHDAAVARCRRHNVAHRKARPGT